LKNNKRLTVIQKMSSQRKRKFSPEIGDCWDSDKKHTLSHFSGFDLDDSDSSGDEKWECFDVKNTTDEAAVTVEFEPSTSSIFHANNQLSKPKRKRSKRLTKQERSEIMLVKHVNLGLLVYRLTIEASLANDNFIQSMILSVCPIDVEVLSIEVLESLVAWFHGFIKVVEDSTSPAPNQKRLVHCITARSATQKEWCVLFISLLLALGQNGRLVKASTGDDSIAFTAAEAYLQPDHEVVHVRPDGQVHRDNSWSHTCLCDEERTQVAYALACNPQEGRYCSVKDVTARYATKWSEALLNRSPSLQKPQVAEAFLAYSPTNPKLEEVDNKQLKACKVAEAIPKNIGHLRNHPVYAIKRYLKKNEVIHPENSIGRIKGEHVYPREDVQVLKTKEKWFQEGFNPKPGVVPSKRTKKGVSLFGLWQCEQIEVPTAKNGLVPNKTYGKLMLFTSRHLPKGCVHLPYPEVHKIAEAHNVDFAHAVVGRKWDVSLRQYKDVFCGIVVCEEFSSLLCQLYGAMRKSKIKGKRSKGF
jgi:hypothetical protein